MELYSGNDSDEVNEGDSAITSERQFWLRIIEVRFTHCARVASCSIEQRCPNSLRQQQRRPPNRAPLRELHTVGREYKLLFFYLRNLLTELT